MDDDDISHQDRFAKELAFLETHPDVVIVGTFMYKIDESGDNTGEIKYPLTNEQIRWQLNFRCSVSNGSSMMRRSIFSSHGFGYSESLKIGEDWKFFIDVIQVHKIANLPDYLYSYRRYSDSVTMKDPELELTSISEIVTNVVRRETGLDLPKSLVPCFIRPRLVKTIAEGLLISKITKRLYQVALKWNMSIEDKRFISENAASRLRQVWQTLNYPLRLFPYVIFSFLIDPSVVKRRLLRHSHIF